MLLRFFTLAALLVATPACFNPDYGDGNFDCTENNAAGLCPDGYQCAFDDDRSTEPGVNRYSCKLGGSAPAPRVVSITTDQESYPRGDRAQVTIEVENFTINPDAIGDPPVDGEGHLHIYVGDIASANYRPVGALEFEYEIPAEFPVGRVKLIAVLAQNNHELIEGSEAATEIEILHPCTVLGDLCERCLDTGLAGSPRRICENAASSNSEEVCQTQLNKSLCDADTPTPIG